VLKDPALHQPPAVSDPARLKYERVPENVTYTWESFKDGCLEALPLMRKHHEEVYDFKDICPFDPLWEEYFALERAGMLHILAVRYKGVLVGYTGIVVGPMLHSRNCLRARGDSFYLDPVFRTGRTGTRMFVEAEVRMKKLGVKRIEWVIKKTLDTYPLLKRWFERRGYIENETTVVQRL
jgi:hypothetical protein